MPLQQKSTHEQWSSSFLFIIAVTTAGLGLGNLWKFPYIAGSNGGGAFVLIYLLCVLFLGLPLLMAEIIIGRHGRENPATSMELIPHNLKFIAPKVWYFTGLVSIFTGALILAYTSVTSGWALNYIFQAAAGRFTDGSSGYIDFIFFRLISSPLTQIACQTLVMAATIAVIARGVKNGLQRAYTFLFRALTALLIGFVLLALKTGYFTTGLAFLFKINLSQLSYNSFLIALGQAFFALSLSTGCIMMYGAYLPKKESLTRTAFIITGANTGVTLLAGLAVYPILYANDLPIAAGPSLIFKTLPQAFGQMHFGSLYASLFFVLVLLAAFASTLALLEPAVSWLMKRTGITRQQASIRAGGVIWLLGVLASLSFNVGQHFHIGGYGLFDLIDYLTANILLPLGGIVIAFFAGWIVQRRSLLAEFDQQDDWRFTVWLWLLRLISPIALGLVVLQLLGIK